MKKWVCFSLCCLALSVLIAFYRTGRLDWITEKHDAQGRCTFVVNGDTCRIFAE